MVNGNRPRTLADLLAPKEEAEFLREVWQTSYSYLEGPAGRYAGLFGWEDLNALLSDHQLDWPRVRLHRNGRQRPQAAYMTERKLPGGRMAGTEVSPHLLARELREGSTLVVNYLAEAVPRLRRLAYSLSRTFDNAVNINLYASWRRDNGFGLHWDDHDVFVLQIAGAKDWQIYPDTAPHPLRGSRKAERRPTKPLWRGRLTDGDILYIPRGWWHIAHPSDEPTLHLTVGIAAVTGLDVLDHLRARLAGEPGFRRDLPLAGGRAAVARRIEELGRELTTAWQDGIADDFLDARAEAATGVRRHGLPATAVPGGTPRLADTAVIRMAVPRRVRLVPTTDGRHVGARLLGRLRRWEATAEPLLRRLFGGEPVEVGELARTARQLDGEAARRLIGELVEEGVAVLWDLTD